MVILILLLIRHFKCHFIENNYIVTNKKNGSSEMVEIDNRKWPKLFYC